MLDIKISCKCKFADKELIKSMGFRWDSHEKRWWKNISKTNYNKVVTVIQGFTWDLKKEK